MYSISKKFTTNLFLFLVTLVAVTATFSFECPTECECSQQANHTYSIKCNTLRGFRKIDKTLPIRTLDLSNLKLTKIPSQLFNIRNIIELNLSNNELSEVTNLNRRIKILNLSNNKITSGKLSKIPVFVENLNLTNNEITYLPLYMMKFKNLTAIELAGNPINCSCDTLHIRNWLSTSKVWSDQHIKCNAPQQFKGQSWLMVRQHEVCHAIFENKSKKSGYNWGDYEGENELMMNDAPADGSDDNEEGYDEDYNDEDDEPANTSHIEQEEEKHETEDDGIEKGYIPVDTKTATTVDLKDIPLENNEEGSGDDIGIVSAEPTSALTSVTDLSEVEGSGSDETSSSLPLIDVTSEDKVTKEDDEDEHGSGAVVTSSEAPPIVNEATSIETENENELDYDDDNDDLEEPPITSPSLGIFQDESTTETTTTTLSAVKAFGEFVPNEDTETDPDSLDQEATKSGTDNTSTYILLAVLAVILVVLIIYVCCKKNSKKSRNRKGKNDIEEGPAKEMSDMNKELLGKPITKNGLPEHIPLIVDGEKEKMGNGDSEHKMPPAKPERQSLEKPMTTFKPPENTEKSQESLYDNNNSTPMQNGNGILPKEENHETDVPDTNHIMPPSSVPKRYSPIYHPTSPKSDRYSPVYSPETGRVKIKLSETPRPKTPVLVTRSRSNAGDIITTTEATDQKF